MEVASPEPKETAEEPLKTALPGKKITIDFLLDNVVGAAGFWQWMVISLSCFSSPSSTLFPVFAESMPNFRCRMEPPIEQFISQTFPNLTIPQLLPYITSSSSGCSRFNLSDWKTHLLNSQRAEGVPAVAPLEPCPLGYVYEPRELQYPGGVVREWDLVCERGAWRAMGTTAFMLGMAVGFMTSGWVSDGLGRKKASILFSLMELVAGFVISASSSFPMYVCLRAVVGVASMGRCAVLIILPIEITTAKHRSVFLSMWGLMQNFFSRSLLALEAYFIPSWRVLHATHNVPSVLALLYFFVMPESPRWLLAKGKCAEAVKVLRRGAKFNQIFGSVANLDESERETLFEEFQRQHCTVATRPKSPKELLRMNWERKLREAMKTFTRPFSTGYLIKLSALNLCVVFCEVFVYFGLLYLAPDLRISIYLATLLSSSMCAVSTVYVAVIYRVFPSRKRPLMGTYGAASVLLIISGLYTLLTEHGNDVLLTVCLNLAVILMQSGLSMIYIFMPELYPSDVRSQGFGYVNGLGRIGAAFCSFCNLLDHTVAHGTPVLIYAGVLLLAVLILLVLPDTDGKNLRDNVVEQKILPSNTQESAES